MNDDIFQGTWKQLRGSAKATWGKLTDDDLSRADGGYDRFVGAPQERYGNARADAEEAIRGALAAIEG